LSREIKELDYQKALRRYSFEGIAQLGDFYLHKNGSVIYIEVPVKLPHIAAIINTSPGGIAWKHLTTGVNEFWATTINKLSENLDEKRPVFRKAVVLFVFRGPYKRDYDNYYVKPAINAIKGTAAGLIQDDGPDYLKGCHMCVKANYYNTGIYILEDNGDRAILWQDINAIISSEEEGIKGIIP